MNITRAEKIVVKVGNVEIGGDNNIVIQSMCNTDTNNIDESLAQIIALKDAGAEMVRLTTQGLREIESLAIIKNKLRSADIDIPLIADVHFSSEVAIAAAEIADKVRINPGNFSKDHEKGITEFRRLISVCKEYGTAIRIGVNHGSLGDRIIEKYGNTPDGMVEAIYEWIRIAEEENFHSLVLSLKASNTIIMSEAYLKLNERGVIYPLHLGVTEAGNGDTGRIKSAAGLSVLLKQGIGDTIRVSLTENPVNEIPVVQKIIRSFDFDKLQKLPVKISVEDRKLTYTDLRTENDWESFIISATCCTAPLLIDKTIDNVAFQACFPEERLYNFSEDLLQATRRKFTKPEYIACPGCGRTKFNLEKTLNDIRQATSHLQGMTIAVMGCIVNGPGEMADADWGYVGEGRGKVSIYRGRSPIRHSIPESEAIRILLEEIEKEYPK